MSRARSIAVAGSAVLALSLLGSVSDAAVARPPGPRSDGGVDSSRIGAATVPSERRAVVLGKAWRTSSDMAWTTSGDATGLHVLVAEARTGYTWRTVATLAEPGLDTDQWIGNACMTGSGDRVVVVYAPRAFTNNEVLARRGGFTAIVDLRNGAVTKLAVMSSLAYFNPGCGTGEVAILTQEGDEDLGKTRLVPVDAEAGKLKPAIVLAGQVTSAVPAGDEIVAASGRQLVRIGTTGVMTPMTPMTTESGAPFSLQPDSEGGVTYLDLTRDSIRVLRAVEGKSLVLATGGWDQLGLSRGRGGTVFITGNPRKVDGLPKTVRQVKAPAGAEVSVIGGLALTSVATKRAPLAGEVVALSDPLEPQPVMIDAVATGTGESVRFAVQPEGRMGGRDPSGGTAPPIAGSTGPGSGSVSALAGSSTSPIDSDRYCSIARNDVRTMAYQPTPRQAEWAVDMAVQGALTVTRPAGFKGFGLPAFSPQSLFPPVAGGVHVPPQIFLGILAQESNLWQATGKAFSGEYGNPLTGNVYGLKLDDTSGEILDWMIHWDDSDCGYGISQRTDGMRMTAHPKPGEVILSATQQRAVALDYATNIAAGMSLIQDKWNQVTDAGMALNNGDPKRIENWFYAAWAYNSGFHKQSEAAQNHGVWGLGWFNNPINPRYSPTRKPFLYHNSWADAAHPERWPYPEKVVGFASYAIDTPDGPGFRPAWWINDNEKDMADPPHALFCDSSNQCDPFSTSGADGGPCLHRYNGAYDSYCWWTRPATWKPACDSTCGFELIRFDTSYPEQPDGTHYPPQCAATSGLPSGSLVIDDVPSGTLVPRCGTASSAGSFSFSFLEDPAMPGTYPGKIDLHQLDGGHNGHFWFAHTRMPGYRDKLKVTGTWTLGQSLNGWARVLIRTPDHGAHTRQARYTLNDVLSSHRVVQQRTQANTWLSLGVFQFNGTPRISLSTQTPDGDGDEDIAWDAIAIQPLSAKPRDFVVSLGDSYSSGEGSSATGGGDYYKETDVDGGDPAWRDACHRSRYAWSRQAYLADSAQSIGARADSRDNTMDYHLIACSGAQTENLLPSGVSNDFGDAGGKWEYGELAQLDQGYIDKNTTLVTVSIGGNDARFAGIVTQCISPTAVLCYNSTLSGDSAPLIQAEPQLIRTAVRQSIVQTLVRIHLLAPNAKIVLMGYPLLLERDGACIVSLPVINVGLNPDEAKWMNDMGDVMAQEMSGAAADATNAGALTWFSDPRQDFAGQGICGNPETIHGIVTDRTPGDTPANPTSAQSFHPKIAGATKYANSLNRTFRSMNM
ncbi:SGNH/GDSL hydrolase family protein [Actinoplanes sp. NPDC051513]|uniref:SGNH/GDSL hydrolase family protein n=1 Tax=Actinoplanes sp. NPDC051513 TaxID=3363908 RepID=UPI00378EEB9E